MNPLIAVPCLVLILIFVDTMRVAVSRRYRNGDHYATFGWRFNFYFFIIPLAAVWLWLVFTGEPTSPLIRP